MTAEHPSLESMAGAAETRGDWVQAEALWRQLLKAQPRHGAGWHRLGKILARHEQWAAALACQRRSAALHPQLGWNWFAAGEALEQLNLGDQAAAAYRQACWWLPQEPWIRLEAQRAERLHWIGGERLAEGFGDRAYRHWCERQEPALPPPGSLLRAHWWLMRSAEVWERLDGRQNVVERQRGPWPRGDGWLLLLANDARLRREALLALEEAIAQSERTTPAELVYPDEDRLDQSGRRHDPWFKPGWVPESFWSSPWLEGCSAWSLAWLRHQRLPPPPVGDATELWAWQLSALAQQPQVLAVPRVLVHRSAAPPADQPQAQRLAEQLQRQLRSQGEPVTVTPAATAGQFRLAWALPNQRPSVQVVIPSKDQATLLGRCLESLQRTCHAYPELLITVVDHASREPATAALLSTWRQRLGPRLQVQRRGGAFNWSQFNNHAIRKSRSPLVLLLNNDVEALSEGWLEVMVAQALRPAIGAVGAVLLYPDRRIQHVGIGLGHGLECCGAEHAYRGLPWPAEVHRGRPQLLSGWPAVTGACLMVRRDEWQREAGFDERLPVEGNDVDFCLRLARRGLRMVVDPAAVLLHHECQSRDPCRSRSLRAAEQRLLRLHAEPLRQLAPWLPKRSSRLHTDGRPAELDGYP